MKKGLILLLMIMFLTSGIALANGMVFDPTEYPEIGEIPVSKTKVSDNIERATTTTTSKQNYQPFVPTAHTDVKQTYEEYTKSVNSNIKESANYAQNTISGQSENFNNALYELDSAQVNIRNDLLEYQAKYQEIDTQYKLIKEQRKILAEQIKSVEKRIKDIERSKNNIRKSMI